RLNDSAATPPDDSSTVNTRFSSAVRAPVSVAQARTVASAFLCRMSGQRMLDEPLTDDPSRDVSKANCRPFCVGWSRGADANRPQRRRIAGGSLPMSFGRVGAAGQPLVFGRHARRVRI